MTAAQVENQKSEVRYERSELEAGQKSETGSQKPDGARECGDGEPRGSRQAARPERSGGLAERAPSGRDDNNAGDQARDVAEEVGEDAEVATTTEGNPAADVTSAPPPDDEGYVWPEGAEAAPEEMKQKAAGLEVANIPLPSLDELVQRIPADVRETLDDLFRVKYVSVKRVSRSSLKS